MSRMLKFYRPEFEWIQQRYPEYIEVLPSYEVKGDTVYVTFETKESYDVVSQKTIEIIMDEIDSNSELTPDGLRFEDAWYDAVDY
ncbi:MAG: hypothetical protein Q3959_06070 [Limosilactobacillus sp.]|uniref:hypothetical protein n=1 Tax=Limosilactobacillus sp. TaxID=2773925 RepID=UPI0026FC02CF|nr:hypothetical protein [Limosilactobacillus sp.]